ncbi:MAG: DUF3857 domain-containing protein [Acidobacteria bacterium]|nr:DUF3857 domain-containing protein [Acidobacteriota bacterium]
MKASSLLAAIVFSFPLFAQQLQPWDAPAFAADPKALIAAAEAVPAGDAAVVSLLDEAVHSFDAQGREHTVWRQMYRVVNESAIDDMGQVGAPWAPWYTTRPSIEARVVTKDGTVHMLDKAAIVEAPARDESLDIFSDNRIVRAPLPAVAVGSVIESVITFDGNNPLADAGSSSMFTFGQYYPVQRARLVIDTPEGVEPRIVKTFTGEPKIETKDGRQRMVFESNRIEGIDWYESNLPSDVAQIPYVAFSTGKSWQEIARRYEELVDKQIAGSDLKKMVATARGNATDRREVIARLLAAIQKEVRYAGVEIGEASIVPRPPRTVLSNKYGDCKDKATLLVAMLREAGIPAHVALLRAGWEFDTIADLPGLGGFNHAIVVVDGETPLWIDPTDEYGRPGALPVQDQGRMALVATAATTSLVRTPEAPSTVSRYVETRTYELPEDGKSRVVETTEVQGPGDSAQRRWYAASDRTKFKEQMEDYVKGYYNARSLTKFEAGDAHDLNKPFVITLEAKDSGTAMVRDGEASVALHPGGLVSQLPMILRNYEEPKPGVEPSKRDRKRVYDFMFPEAGVKEWTYRIKPPIGYEPRQLPPAETRKLGTTTLTTKYETDPKGTVVATLTFDTGKRRITPAEFEETRIALSKLVQGDQIIIGFDSVGQAKLNQGDVASALQEFKRLADLHPKEAQHHVELARALLVGGLGDAAREEAKRAVALEPSNPRAHRALGVTYEYDAIGRVTRKGFDPVAAAASLRKAKELEPTDMELRVSLARILTYDDEGHRFTSKAQLGAAADEYVALKKDFGESARGYAGERLLVLCHAGRWKDVQAMADDADTPQEQRDLAKLIGIAVQDGPEAGVRALGSYDPTTRRNHALTLGRTFLALRLYPQAAAMFDASAQGAQNSAETRRIADMLRKTKRVDDYTAAPTDAPSVVQKMIYAVFLGDMKTAESFFDKEVVDAMKDDDSEEMSLELAMRDASLPPAVVAEMTTAAMQMQTEGDDKLGYRVRMRMAGTGASGSATFVTREKDGTFRVHATSDQAPAIGWSVLRFADAGDLEKARTWLNWAREDVQAGGGDDPLAGSPFASIWPKEKATATADEIRTAAASMMMVKKLAPRSAPVLAEMRTKVPEPQRKWVDVALVRAYLSQREYAKALPIAEELAKAHPESGSAFLMQLDALVGAGRPADAQALAKKRLEKMPKDRDALRAMVRTAVVTRDYATAQKYAQQIVDDLAPTSADYNEVAWMALYTGSDMEKAIESARQASEADTKGTRAASLHTLAALYAETGKNLEAREALLKGIDTRMRDQPASSDWYVLGRIAENYGVRDAALAAYKHVTKEEDPGATVWELTEKRLAALGGKGR